MQLDLDYAIACLPDKTRVLGRTLHDFTAGHLLVLHRISSPYVFGGTESTLENFMEAVAICSTDWRRASENIWTGNTFALRTWVRAWALVSMLNPERVFLASKAFENYISSAMLKPPGMFESQNGQRAFAPLLALFFDDLAGRYTWNDFLDQPLQKLIFERYHLLTKDGVASWSQTRAMKMKPEDANA